MVLSSNSDEYTTSDLLTQPVKIEDEQDNLISPMTGMNFKKQNPIFYHLPTYHFLNVIVLNFKGLLHVVNYYCFIFFFHEILFAISFYLNFIIFFLN